jgi:5-methylcytosine-specific restriction endonuclease McrA
MKVEDWVLIHSDAWHPGGRDNCTHCQEMIAINGPMPSAEEIRAALRKRVKEDNKNKYKKVLIPEDIRWAVWERDDFRCRHCGARRYLRVDHIIPESKGGTLDLDNLQTLCNSCNAKKGTKCPK